MTDLNLMAIQLDAEALIEGHSEGKFYMHVIQ